MVVMRKLLAQVSEKYKILRHIPPGNVSEIIETKMKTELRGSFYAYGEHAIRKLKRIAESLNSDICKPRSSFIMWAI